MKDISDLVRRFRDLRTELRNIEAAQALLHWDQETMMPKGGIETRSKVDAALAAVYHEKAVSPAYEDVLRAILEYADDRTEPPAVREVLDGVDWQRTAINVRKAWKALERKRKLPAEFVRELAELTSAGQACWAEARKTSDFGMFLSTLERMVAMKRQEAALVGFPESPYDALLDDYEPDTRTNDIRSALESLRSFLTPFVRRIAESSIKIDPDSLSFPAPKDVQVRINRRVAEAMGFDFTQGRLDESTHPFTTRLHAGDTRITTRYREDRMLRSLTGTMHEAGHGLYEQGLPEGQYGLPTGEAISMGIHESQSRIWENMVGRSRPFCEFLADLLQSEGVASEHKRLSARLHRALNIVRPSLIRVEADEVTYNLHICLRFELEVALIEGRLEVADLRDAWNEKTREYLGLEVPDDAQGVLQDVHWSVGYFGYFPTYALGNLYAAQLYARARNVIPDLEDGFVRGDFRPFREWLNANVHSHGSAETADQLIHRVTGGPLDARYFTAYLERKYAELYKL